MPALAAPQTIVLRVLSRAVRFVVLQHVCIITPWWPGGQSASRRYIYVHTGAELLAFHEDLVPERPYSSARLRRIG